MSCDFFERHFIAGGPPEAFDAHRAQCADCRRLSTEMIRLAAIESRVDLPQPSAALAARWRAIPSQTTNCENASELTAASVETPLAEPDRARWATHLGRCAECRETAAVLGMMPSLKRPVPASGAAPARQARVISFAGARRKVVRRAAWMDPRLYAAAACLLAGFFAIFANTLDARAFSQSVGRQARVRWAEASDRFQLWEQGASRQLVATRESLTGYTKAAGAIALSAAGRATEGLFRTETKTEKGNKS